MEFVENSGSCTTRLLQAIYYFVKREISCINIMRAEPITMFSGAINANDVLGVAVYRLWKHICESLEEQSRQQQMLNYLG